jgi:hypothetical protein
VNIAFFLHHHPQLFSMPNSTPKLPYSLWPIYLAFVLVLALVLFDLWLLHHGQATLPPTQTD